MSVRFKQSMEDPLSAMRSRATRRYVCILGYTDFLEDDGLISYREEICRV